MTALQQLPARLPQSAPARLRRPLGPCKTGGTDGSNRAFFAGLLSWRQQLSTPELRAACGGAAVDACT
eukprot:1267012-Alexandrium_andersonii.AAC.1